MLDAKKNYIRRKYERVLLSQVSDIQEDTVPNSYIVTEKNGANARLWFEIDADYPELGLSIMRVTKEAITYVCKEVAKSITTPVLVAFNICTLEKFRYNPEKSQTVLTRLDKYEVSVPPKFAMFLSNRLTKEVIQGVVNGSTEKWSNFLNECDEEQMHDLARLQHFCMSVADKEKTNSNIRAYKMVTELKTKELRGLISTLLKLSEHVLDSDIPEENEYKLAIEEVRDFI